MENGINYTGCVKSKSAEFDIYVTSELLSDDFSCCFLNRPDIFKMHFLFWKIFREKL